MLLDRFGMWNNGMIGNSGMVQVDGLMCRIASSPAELAYLSLLSDNVAMRLALLSCRITFLKGGFPFSPHPICLLCKPFAPSLLDALTIDRHAGCCALFREPATLDLAAFAGYFHLVALSAFHSAGFASYDGAILPLASSELPILVKMDGLVESPVDLWCCRFGVMLMWPIRQVWMSPMIGLRFVARSVWSWVVWWACHALIYRYTPTSDQPKMSGSNKGCHDPKPISDGDIAVGHNVLPPVNGPSSSEAPAAHPSFVSWPSPEMTSQASYEIGIEYQGNPVRCSLCNRLGYSNSRCHLVLQPTGRVRQVQKHPSPLGESSKPLSPRLASKKVSGPQTPSPHCSNSFEALLGLREENSSVPCTDSNRRGVSVEESSKLIPAPPCIDVPSSGNEGRPVSIIRIVDQSSPPCFDNQDSRTVSHSQLEPTMPSGYVAHISLGQQIIPPDSNPLLSGCMPPTAVADFLSREVMESSDVRSSYTNNNVGVDSQKDTILPIPFASHGPPLSHQDRAWPSPPSSLLVVYSLSPPCPDSPSLTAPPSLALAFLNHPTLSASGDSKGSAVAGDTPRSPMNNEKDALESAGQVISFAGDREGLAPDLVIHQWLNMRADEKQLDPPVITCPISVVRIMVLLHLLQKRQVEFQCMANQNAEKKLISFPSDTTCPDHCVDVAPLGSPKKLLDQFDSDPSFIGTNVHYSNGENDNEHNLSR
ncbi:hypothetical protein Nepgr_030918 [Nepenthes gracilis]|uniref:Uncharacterized protein n=1 Tax=Nepenthes gracilis TaxID=150966 RepID=A0AAD3TFG5_NEPGR|nr:hypothetical protein Nepgr_030918 [Nepenthes gracilis]